MIGEEVKEALWSIPEEKSPSSDDFGSHFYKDSWVIVGNDDTATVMNFFNSEKLLKEVNNTIVTLIPKVKCLSSVTEYRPNSLFYFYLKMYYKDHL